MRIELVKDVIYSHIHNAVGIYLIDILVIDVINQAVELVFLGVGGEEFFRAVIEMQFAADKNPKGQGKCHNGRRYVVSLFQSIVI